MKAQTNSGVDQRTEPKNKGSWFAVPNKAREWKDGEFMAENHNSEQANVAFTYSIKRTVANVSIASTANLRIS